VFNFPPKALFIPLITMSSKSITRSLSSISSKTSSVKTAIKKGAKALTQPLKKAKTRFSARSKSSSTVDRETASTDSLDGHVVATGDDNASTVDNSSDIEIVEVDQEKELGTSIYCYH